MPVARNPTEVELVLDPSHTPCPPTRPLPVLSSADVKCTLHKGILLTGPISPASEVHLSNMANVIPVGTRSNLQPIAEMKLT